LHTLYNLILRIYHDSDYIPYYTLLDTYVFPLLYITFKQLTSLFNLCKMGLVIRSLNLDSAILPIICSICIVCVASHVCIVFRSSTSVLSDFSRQGNRDVRDLATLI